MARWTGLEPATPGVTGRYSNQLSYNRTSARARPNVRGYYGSRTVASRTRRKIYAGPAPMRLHGTGLDETMLGNLMPARAGPA